MQPSKPVVPANVSPAAASSSSSFSSSTGLTGASDSPESPKQRLLNALRPNNLVFNESLAPDATPSPAAAAAVTAVAVPGPNLKRQWQQGKKYGDQEAQLGAGKYVPFSGSSASPLTGARAPVAPLSPQAVANLMYAISLLVFDCKDKESLAQLAPVHISLLDW